MPIRIAAEALGMDPQTVRVMIQMGVVPWGRAFKLPESKKYRYIISPKSFYEETGFCGMRKTDIERRNRPTR